MCEMKREVKTGKKCVFCSSGYCKLQTKHRGAGFGTVPTQVWVCEACEKEQPERER